MAVFTELSDEDRQSITAAYGFRSLLSVIGIADGDSETTYLFRAKEGEFIVTLFENGAQPLDLERAFETMEALYRKGVPCPKPLRTHDGKATCRAAGRLVAVVSFVPGSSSTTAGAAKCRSLGRVMAQVHIVLERKAKCTSTDLPSGAVHGALVHENIFFLGDEVSGVINFRLRHDDTLLSEVADVIVGWAGESNGELNKERARALLQGYEEVRRLTGVEKEALPGFIMASTSKRLASQKEKTFLPEIAMVAYRSVTPDILG
ncbi:homoserine kinase [Sinorhizobium sp. CCBAU 05631]|uniref:homoserine kinase n=1 Tax=Sinorhizobium sp. CCBAU 05631 TaxID=794846 RepID=UPI000565D51F|nr:homoserine kinase [Sinorhizobium sp. CCBAU 05631]ASY57768.1 Homoserine kinase [Sinorhizobium sp. CCBAU 05631]